MNQPRVGIEKKTMEKTIPVIELGPREILDLNKKGLGGTLL